MALPNDNISMALYCDFENVALGVRDSKYNKFDIKPVLERLLLKGSIVVKKAYCDWDRYKEFKPQMHEASFELIEIPHVRQSGKNSADIRLVVDALDLCYTKAHVNTFVIISGDSDFSPLVSKLRENAKFVIGVGVKDSTSDLLIANCDEFIFIDDLMRESRRTVAKRAVKQAPAAARPGTEEEQPRKEELEARKSTALDIALETFEALLVERGDTGKIWASTLKQAIKRRKPDFNETYFGFKTFGNLLDEAQARGLMEIGRDERSGAYVSRSGTVRQDANAAADAAPLTGLSTSGEQPLAATEAAAREQSQETNLTGIALSTENARTSESDTGRTERTRGAGRKSAAKKSSALSQAERNDVLLPVGMSEAPAQSVGKKAATKRRSAPRKTRGKSEQAPAGEEAVLQMKNDSED